MSEKEPIVILGAGVIGLTTAVRLLSSPIDKPIHIVADHFPNDPLDPLYASTAAGAHHLSFAGNDDRRQRQWDRRTFEILWEEMLAGQEGLMKIKQTEYYDGEEKHLDILAEHPEFVVHDKDNLPPFATHSVSFLSLSITPLVYLNHLLDILAPHVTFHRHRFTSIQDIPIKSPAAIVNCTGGLATDTYPVRGQVVKVFAPWIKTGYTRQIGSLNGGEGGQRTYIIPRADGEVILGGTREVNDTYPLPRPETTIDILNRALEICPELLPLDKRSIPNPTGKDLLDIVVQEIVGFRPARKEGIRLEMEEVEIGGKKVKVVHNYGHGGAGWQSCWGTAEDAVGLLTDL